MELSQLLPIAVDLPITLPTGEDTGIKFKVVGEDSAQYRKGAKAVAAAFYADDKPSPDVLERLNTELFAGCVVGWSGLTENGEPMPYSPERALELMANPQLTFIRQQVEAFVSKRATFFRQGA